MARSDVIYDYMVTICSGDVNDAAVPTTQYAPDPGFRDVRLVVIVVVVVGCRARNSGPDVSVPAAFPVRLHRWTGET